MSFALRCLCVLSLAASAGGCARRGGVDRVEWMVMGTVAAVQTKDGADPVPARETARKCFSAIEKLLDAHNPSSELSRLSALEWSEVAKSCDSSVRKCYKTAFRISGETDGAFSPAWKGPGTLDLGAIAKGFALDEAAEAIRLDRNRKGAVLLDLGGNLKAVRGDWKVAVYGSNETVILKEGAAIATSGETFRGRHIYDARTGKPAGSSVRSVSVVHPSSAMLADALSTVMFILGREKGSEFLKSRYPEAVAIWL